MTFQNPSDDALRSILEKTQNIAVVGLSNDESRDSYRVARYLQQHGYRIIPVNPRVNEVLGERSFPTLQEVDEDIDIVDVFRRSDAVQSIVHDALQTSAKVIWTQLGVTDTDAADVAVAAGRIVVMDRCIKVEHQRLFN